MLLLQPHERSKAASFSIDGHLGIGPIITQLFQLANRRKIVFEYTHKDASIRGDISKRVKDMADAVVVHRGRCFSSIYAVVGIVCRILEHYVGDALGKGGLRGSSTLAQLGGCAVWDLRRNRAVVVRHLCQDWEEDGGQNKL